MTASVAVKSRAKDKAKEKAKPKPKTNAPANKAPVFDSYPVDQALFSSTADYYPDFIDAYSSGYEHYLPFQQAIQIPTRKPVSITNNQNNIISNNKNITITNIQSNTISNRKNIKNNISSNKNNNNNNQQIRKRASSVSLKPRIPVVNLAPKSASAPVKVQAKVPVHFDKTPNSNFRTTTNSTSTTTTNGTGATAPISVSSSVQANLKCEPSSPTAKPPIQSQRNSGFITNNQNNKITNNKNIKISINQQQKQNTSVKNGTISSSNTIIRDDLLPNTNEPNQSATKKAKLTNSTDYETGNLTNKWLEEYQKMIQNYIAQVEETVFYITEEEANNNWFLYDFVPSW